MKIKKKKDGTKLTITVEGRLNTKAAPELEEVVKKSIGGITELIFDMKKLDYISSAALRVLLLAEKTMEEQGTMVVKNVKQNIYEILEVTGLSGVLTIEAS